VKSRFVGRGQGPREEQSSQWCMVHISSRYIGPNVAYAPLYRYDTLLGAASTFLAVFQPQNVARAPGRGHFILTI
jgi:hypothetical protein